MKNILFAWSGGKDSSYALWKVLNNPEYNVIALMTTYNKNLGRVSMHGVKIELARKQAEEIGLPLIEMSVSEGSYDEYERNMEAILIDYKAKHNITGVAFGDIFLSDLKKYREDNLAKVDLEGYFPIWKEDTTTLPFKFIEAGFKTTLCCCADGYLNENHVGAEYSKQFLRDLPKEVDPCGENGEFHSYCYAGPIFKNEIKIKKGEKIHKALEEKFWTKENPTRGFWYQELLIS